MRVGANLFLAALVVSSCTRILGIDGRYVHEQDGIEASGGVTFGSSGGAFDGDVGAGGEPSTGGTGGSIGSTGGRTGGGGIILSGGAGGSAGGAVTGGAGGSESGGVAGTGGAPIPDAQAPCDPSMKNCNGNCVTPDPSVGCGLTGCDRCTNAAPTDGYLVCTNDACDFACSQGTKNATTQSCDLPTSGSGGSGGAGGAGSIGAKCNHMQNPLAPSPDCKYCGVFPGCCNPITGDRCGCLYVAACI